MKHRHRFKWLGYLINAEFPRYESNQASWCRCGALKTEKQANSAIERVPHVIEEMLDLPEEPVVVKVWEARRT